MIQLDETNVVTSIDADLHAKRRKLVAPIYAAPNIASPKSQSLWDRLSRHLLDEANGEIAQNGHVNIYILLRWFAVDAVSYFVYGEENCFDTLRNRQQRKTHSFVIREGERSKRTISQLMLLWWPGERAKNDEHDGTTLLTVPQDLVRSFMRLGWNPSGMQGRIMNTETGVHQHSLKALEQSLTGEKSLKVGTPSHIDLLTQRYLEGKTPDLIPSSRYIAGDAIDHVLAGKTSSR